MFRQLFSLLLICIVGSVSGQVTFTNATIEIMGPVRTHSTVAMGVDDINGDYKDDLIVLDEGKFLTTFTQTGSDRSFEFKEHTQTSVVGEWSMITGDLDNDGKPEIIASGNENGSEVLFSNNGTYLTSQITTPIYSQNSNLIDLNGDGYLDLFVCNDVGENITYINNGNGNLSAVKLIDFKVSDADDMSGNYSSIFTDIDGDGDMDLYIGKCRASASEPTDPRRINTLYINNGDGTYVESAASFGLANGSQSWSVDSGDVDNDGDMDLIIANHDREHDLMINDGNGHFDRFNNLPDESKNFAYQSFFCDFDNNGWLDIFITEPGNSYILFNNEMVFSQYDASQNGRGAFTGVIGDFNSDGFPDLCLGFADSFQSTGSRADIVRLNNGNANNWLQINLEGTESGYDAIGSSVTIYSGDEIKKREITAGKSYGIMNSTVAHFGLGSIELIDSVRIEWNSGNTTILKDGLDVNGLLIISEDGCVTRRLELANRELCDDNDEITINLDEEYDTYLWSDGSTDSMLSVIKHGSYFVETMVDGCRSVSNYFTVSPSGTMSKDEMIYGESKFGCNNQEVIISTNNAQAYEWSTGDTTQSIAVSEPGSYVVTVTTNCNTYISDSYDVDFKDYDLPDIIGDTVQSGIQATLVCSGETVNWFRFVNDEISLFNGSVFETLPLLRDTTFYAGVINSDDGLSDILMTPVPLNSNADNLFESNDTLEFSVFAPIRISSVSVRTQISGRRLIEVYNERNLVRSMAVDMESGVNIIALDLRLDSGKYRMTTNQNVNMDELDSPNPKFSYSNLFIGNDKKINQCLKIGESTVYPEEVPYFFDWRVDYDFYLCEDRYAVHAKVDDMVSTNNTTINFNIVPNPSNGIFQVEYDGNTHVQLEIYNMDGQLLLEKDIHNSKDQIVSNLLPGTYIIKISDNKGIYNQLINIQN